MICSSSILPHPNDAKLFLYSIAADWPLAMDIEKLVPEDKVESEYGFKYFLNICIL